MIHSSASQLIKPRTSTKFRRTELWMRPHFFRTKSGIISVLKWKYCRLMIPPWEHVWKLSTPPPSSQQKKTPKMAGNLVCDPSAAVSPSGSSYYSLQRPLRPYAKPAGLVLENGQNITFWYILQGVRQRHNGCCYTNMLYIAQYGQWVRSMICESICHLSGRKSHAAILTTPCHSVLRILVAISSLR